MVHDGRAPKGLRQGQVALLDLSVTGIPTDRP